MSAKETFSVLCMIPCSQRYVQSVTVEIHSICDAAKSTTDASKFESLFPNKKSWMLS